MKNHAKIYKDAYFSPFARQPKYMRYNNHHIRDFILRFVSWKDMVIIMMIPLNCEELSERIERSFKRLCEPYYSIEEVFSPKEYDWQGDKEGRALLSFVCHAEMGGEKIPCMEKLIEKIPEKTNKYFFFGEKAGDYINEQQLSGHSWYLRGLLAYYELYGSKEALKYAESTVKHLYMPARGKFSSYPIDFIREDGDVAGNSGEIVNGWLLSTDTGCAFMAIDGLSHYYAVTGDKAVLELLYEMRETFDKIDKMAIKAQTHCCLTAARGFIRLYGITEDTAFLSSAKKIWELYVDFGMTYTYQNFNWWGKGNTWTEPCAVVDSLMLAGELFKITNDEAYRITAARIWHNGFSAMQVGNGGAGPTTTVSDTEPILKTQAYEAPFCCTMRLAEGLLYAKRNKEILYAVTADVKKDNVGRYMLGDIIYAQVTCSEEAEKYIDRSKEITVDDIKLIPIVKYYNLPKEVTDSINQKIIFSKNFLFFSS